jgi:hypothetical protein
MPLGTTLMREAGMRPGFSASTERRVASVLQMSRVITEP